MTNLVFPFTSDHFSDLDELKSSLEKSGYTARLSDIESAWKLYSDRMAAGWLNVGSYSDEDRVAILLRYLQPETE